MAVKYPFQTGEELKQFASGIDIELNLTNLNSGFNRAASELKDIIGAETYVEMLAHYNNTELYNQIGETDTDLIRLNSLVELCQAAMANFGILFHFVWLRLRISNNSITVTKSDNEDRPYKYDLDEARETLLQNAWAYVTELFDFLDTEATAFTTWAAATEYAIGDIVLYSGTYYKCTTAHTSIETFEAGNFTDITMPAYTYWQTEIPYILNQVVKFENTYYECTNPHTSAATFAADAANWSAIEVTPVIFSNWTNSVQKLELTGLLFDSYKDFDRFFGIDKCPVFYIKARHFIRECVDDELIPLVKSLTGLTSVILNQCKRAVAYRVMGRACVTLDSYSLPANIRDRIGDSSGNKTKGQHDEFIRTNLSNGFNSQADRLFERISLNLAAITQEPTASGTLDYENTPDPDKSFASII